MLTYKWNQSIWRSGSAYFPALTIRFIPLRSISDCFYPTRKHSAIHASKRVVNHVPFLWGGGAIYPFLQWWSPGFTSGEAVRPNALIIMVMVTCEPSPLWTDRRLWKHYLPATSFAAVINSKISFVIRVMRTDFFLNKIAIEMLQTVIVFNVWGVHTWRVL